MRYEGKRQLIHIRLDESKNAWLTEQAKAQGISKNDVIQLLINKEMKSGSG